jgi:aspartyl/glutamyl-tRNA(Asn/Gln) amidotransferase C subunit
MNSYKFFFPEIQKICRLAKLNLTLSQKKKFQKQIAETLQYISIINELKTKKLPPTSQVNNLTNIWRPDKKSQGLNIKQALANARSTEKNYFKIKSIF